MFGHKKVSILNGGLSAWQKANGPTISGPLTSLTPKVGAFKASFDKRQVVAVKDVLDVVETGSKQILDARSSGRLENI